MTWRHGIAVNGVVAGELWCGHELKDLKVLSFYLEAPASSSENPAGGLFSGKTFDLEGGRKLTKSEQLGVAVLDEVGLLALLQS